MVHHLEELVLLLLRTSGMCDAILTYEEETGASHVEAAAAVSRLVQERGSSSLRRAPKAAGPPTKSGSHDGLAGLPLVAAKHACTARVLPVETRT